MIKDSKGKISMGLLKRIEKDNSAISISLFLFCITLLGLFLRIQYLQKSDFVINDGGMFYAMILDLQKNNYILPVFTSYNQSQIPYAYPPLSFYSGAFLNQFLHIDLITIFRVYPLFFNVLSIPAVYFLVKEITRINRQALLATAFYSILLSSYEWLISGGGLTRSPAHTLFIIALTLYLVFLRTRRWRWLILSTITAVLMILHHIEYGWIFVLSFLLFSTGSLQFKDFVKTAFIYFLGIGLITAPYWGTVLAYHGISPFISAFKTGDFSLAISFGRLMLMVFTRESIINFINVLSIIGLLFYLFSGKSRLVIWLLMIIFLDPRSAERLLIFPVVIFAAFAIDRVLLPAAGKIGQESEQPTTSSTPKTLNYSVIKPNLKTILIGFSILFPFLLGFLHTFEDTPSLSMIPQSQIEAMNWIKTNTPKDSQFLVIESLKTWSLDKVSEWFPALSERKSLLTIQGTEWLPDSTFALKSKANDALKNCLNSGETCLDSWEKENNISFSHLLITKINCAASVNYCPDLLLASIKESNKYTVIYENEGTAVFQKN